MADEDCVSIGLASHWFVTSLLMLLTMKMTMTTMTRMKLKPLSFWL